MNQKLLLGLLFGLLLLLPTIAYCEEYSLMRPKMQDIAFSDGNNLYAMDSNGKNIVALTDDGGQLHTDSKGNVVTTSVWIIGDLRIYTYYTNPSWSPDGKKIAYLVRVRAENITGQTVSPTGGINLVDVTSQELYDKYGLGILDLSDLSKETLIFTEDISAQDNFVSSGPIRGRPSWSPDSQKIMFSAEGYINSVIWGDEFLRSDRIYTINYNGTGLERMLTSTNSAWDCFFKTYIFKDLFHISSVDWSPDGKIIVFDKRFPYKNNTEHLWTANLDGTNQNQLTLEMGTYPDWTCDGNMILYATEGAKVGPRYTTDVMWINPDGTGKQTAMTDGNFPSVSSNKDIVLTDPTNPFNFLVFDSTGKNLQNVTLSLPVQDPNWKKPC